jgi:hypothetical protein
MDKTAIKNFAIWARNKLIADITYRASLLGITEDGIQAPLPQSTADIQMFDIGTAEPYTLTGKAISQRAELVREIEERAKDADYKTAFHNTVEEAAYTWFNRLIALRFMEVNDYLPSRMRILSSASPNKVEPDVVTNPFDAGFDFTPEEVETIGNLKSEDRVDDVFQLLFIKQCNALNACLPGLFEKTSDYTEVLLNLSVTDRDGVVYHLVHDIPEDNFNVNAADDEGNPIGQVEIIGWLYQYYNTEPKAAVFAGLKSNIKITKETLPAATQLFTPDWIVRYMVENSLGRLWVEGHPNDELKSNWKYYLDEAEQEADVQEQLDAIYAEHAKLKPEEISCIDPCCGSGHILVYMFDVLMQIYQSQGYSERDAARSIVENNLYGLDIDKRAAQLAYFAVMMKARQYDRRFLRRNVQPHIYAICESNAISEYCLQYFAGGDKKLDEEIHGLVENMNDACEYGSILQIPQYDFDAMFKRCEVIEQDINLYSQEVQNYLMPIIRVAYMLSRQYDICVTNPPYMGGSNMDPKLSKFVKKHYPDSKSDIFSSVIEKALNTTCKFGYIGYIAPQSLMFLKSQELLRKKIASLTALVCLIDLGTKVFDSGFGTATMILGKKRPSKAIARCFDLNNKENKSKFFLKKKAKEYLCSNNTFQLLPSNIFSYSCTSKFGKTFKLKKIGEYLDLDCGIKTGNNNYFVRLWFEPSCEKIALNDSNLTDLENGTYKWFKYSQGGGFNRWYGAIENVVNLQNNAVSIKKMISKSTYRLRDKNKYFLAGMVWPMVGTDNFSSRYLANDVLPDIASNVIYCHKKYEWGLLAYLNSKVFNTLMIMINPTVNYPIDSVGAIPYIQINNSISLKINNFCQKNVKLCKDDWDSFETSWDFKKHPLINDKALIKDAYKAWKMRANEMYKQLKANEEELNRIFIDIYDLQDELTPNVPDYDITVQRVFDTQKDIPNSMYKSETDKKGKKKRTCSKYAYTLRDSVKSFVSYAVGCMFGRYSLDVDGLAYAGGDWDESKYKTFMPDTDNVLPITDEEYLDDDIVARFVKFVETVYGTETLEDNLTFIAGALGNRGKTSREVIRNYFLKDFYKDHCNTYQKRPIYWLYDSGKQNGFKALIYMHRYNKYTSGMVRVDYLHKLELAYSSEIERMEDTTIHSKSAREVTQAQKRIEKLKKQLKECQDYDSELGHIARDQIAIDLDDGVKVNYRKAQTGRDGKFYPILADSKKIMANDKLWKEYLTEWPHKKEEP